MNMRCACSVRNRPAWCRRLCFVALGLVVAASGRLVLAADGGSSRGSLETIQGRAVAIVGMTGLPIDRHLRDLGWQVGRLDWGRRYTAADLKRFHVVVLATHPIIKADAAMNDQFVVSPEYHGGFQAAAEEYVKAGGGLLVYQALWPSNSLEPINKFLAPFGARLLEEAIRDEEHSYTQDSGMLWEWFSTTNIARHESTAGVRRLFYPVRDLHVPAHAPLSLTPDWEPLVRGMASASSHPTNPVQQNRVIDATVTGSFATAPPIAAVRSFGKGRVATFGWCPTQTFFNYKHFMVQDVHFAGTTKTPSDGMKFLEQTLDHLSAPAILARLGGYTPEPTGAQVPLETTINWPSVAPVATGGRWWKGLIGARSALTGGSGRPADYAKAAEQTGLDFIALLEDMTKLQPTEWDAFRAECRAASTAKVLVLPGLVELRGDAETEYFFVGDGPLPPSDMRSADGRTVQNYLYAHFAMGVWTHGPFSLKRQRTPPWISRAYTAQAVVTTLRGESAVEMGPYLYNVGIQDCPRPVAIDRIDSPAEVAAAAGRYLTLRKADTLAGVREAFQHADRRGCGQVSNGPLIKTFEGVNATRDSLGRMTGGRERFQLQLVAESDAPLREAIIYNGSEIHRRLDLQGRHCNVTINGVHDRQYMFTAVVFDNEGRFSVCGPLDVHDLFNRRFMCSDRQNSIGVAVRSNKTEERQQIESCLFQHKFQIHGDLPGEPGSAATVSWVPWYWDGSPGPMFRARLLNGLVGAVPPNSSPPITAVHRMMFPLGSQDVIVQAAATEGRCQKPVHSQEFTPVQPLPYRADVRFHEFRKRPDAPSSMLIEGQYEMLEDVAMTPRPWLYETRISAPFFAFEGRPSASARWSVINPEGTGDADRVFPPKTREFNAFQSIEPGGYLAFTSPQGSLAFFPLDEPLGCWLWLHDEKWLRGWAGLPRPSPTIPKGTRMPYRAVVFNGTPTAPATRDEVERFRREFGLTGPPGYACDVHQGRILSQQYVLEAQADRGGFSARFAAADLMHDLPIRVHGVNQLATCVVADERTKEWRPVGMTSNLTGVTPGNHESAAYVAIDLSRPQTVWIGNPVVCDAAEVRIALFTDGGGRFSVEAHNPTLKPIETTIRSNPGSPLLSLAPTPIRLAPRSSQVIELP